jgi:hypothetical protein
MKITINQLRRIIKEEIEKNLGEVDVREEVKQIILSHENINKIAALLKDPTRTFESYSALMEPIVDDIKKLHPYDGIAAYNSLIQKDLKDLLAFTYPPGYRSSRESPSEPEDIGPKKYLDRINRKRGLGPDVRR